MDKPIQLVIEETKTTIVQAANNSGLPMWLINQIMTDLARQTSDLAKKEYEIDVTNYQKSLEEEEENED